MLPYTALCSAFKKNLSFCSGLRFKEEKGSPWKLAVTFARLFCKSLLPPLSFPILLLVLVRVCDSSQRLKYHISFPAFLLPTPASSPKGALLSTSPGMGCTAASRESQRAQIVLFMVRICKSRCLGWVSSVPGAVQALASTSPKGDGLKTGVLQRGAFHGATFSGARVV